MPTTQRTNTPHDQTDNSTVGELLVYLYYDTCIIIIGTYVPSYVIYLIPSYYMIDYLVYIVYVPPYMLYSLFIITWYVPSYLYLGRGTPVTKKHLDLPTQLFSNYMYSGFQAAVCEHPGGENFQMCPPGCSRNFWSGSFWKGVEKKFRLARSFAPSRSAPETSDSLARQRRSAGEGRERGDAPRSSRSFGFAPSEPRSSCRTAPRGWRGK